MSYQDWEQLTVNPLEVRLDQANFRLDLGDKPTEQQIIMHLIAQERLLDLVTDLSENSYLKVEPVTLVRESEQLIVLEGNRRIAACKLLINPKLIQRKLPNIKPELLQGLYSIPAVIAPNRAEVYAYIAKRHVKAGGIQPWSTEAKQKAVTSFFQTGHSVSDIVTMLGLKKNEIETRLKEAGLLSFVKNLPIWTEVEKGSFSRETNAFTRFFNLATKDKSTNASKLLSLRFTPKYEIASTMNFEEFQYYMGEIARGFLLSPKRFNTRSSVETVFREIGHPDFNDGKSLIDLSHQTKITTPAAKALQLPLLAEQTNDLLTILSPASEITNDENGTLSTTSIISVIPPVTNSTNSPTQVPNQVSLIKPMSAAEPSIDFLPNDISTVPVGPINIVSTQIDDAQNHHITNYPSNTASTDDNNVQVSNQDQQPALPTQRTIRNQSVKPFLKGLKCSVSDDILIKMTKEINEIDYEKFPIAAAMLTRALIHAALLYLFKSKGREHVLQSDGFDHVLKKAVDEQAHLFDRANQSLMVTVISNFQDKKFKTYLDKIVHPHPVVRSTPLIVADIGQHFRGLLEYILNKGTYDGTTTN